MTTTLNRQFVTGIAALGLIATGAWYSIVRADEKPAVPPLNMPPDQFEKFQILIKPVAGEMCWRNDVPWLTNLTEARVKAAAEGKPILVWMAADGHPLGAT